MSYNGNTADFGSATGGSIPSIPVYLTLIEVLMRHDSFEDWVVDLMAEDFDVDANIEDAHQTLAKNIEEDAETP